MLNRNECRSAATMLAVAAVFAAPGAAVAGGLYAYELGTADLGLASAGYGARAQDASTVYTNPAGMTRLDGNQILGAGQLFWANTKYSPGTGTSPGLGDNDGGYAVGKDGWFPGGGGFGVYTLSPNVKLGMAVVGTFGGVLNYENDWVGRYYVQQTWTVGLSLLPSIAWKVNDKLSLGASLNAMFGIYKNNLAINNANPLYGDGRMKLKDETWGFGANLGLLYEFTPTTRLGLTWNSEVSLDFAATPDFAGLTPAREALLDKSGLRNASIEVGMKAPQQAMLSLYTQVDPKWALLGSVGWQQWSKFGAIQLGIDNIDNPKSLTTAIPFKDTWHVAAGAQYRLSEPWTLNFGIAYDSAFQENSDQVSPLFPTNSAWRFGFGGEKRTGKDSFWGVSAEYLYGGTLKTNLHDPKPVIAGGKGDLVGNFNNTGVIFVGGYYNWTF